MNTNAKRENVVGEVKDKRQFLWLLLLAAFVVVLAVFGSFIHVI